MLLETQKSVDNLRLCELMPEESLRLSQLS